MRVSYAVEGLHRGFFRHFSRGWKGILSLEEGGLGETPLSPRGLRVCPHRSTRSTWLRGMLVGLLGVSSLIPLSMPLPVLILPFIRGRNQRNPPGMLRDQGWRCSGDSGAPRGGTPFSQELADPNGRFRERRYIRGRGPSVLGSPPRSVSPRGPRPAFAPGGVQDEGLCSPPSLAPRDPLPQTPSLQLFPARGAPSCLRENPPPHTGSRLSH